MTAALAAVAVLLAFAGARELSASSLGARLATRLNRGLPSGSAAAELQRLATRLDLEGRLTRAGLERRISLRGFLLLKGAGALAGLIVGSGVIAVAPERLRPLILVGVAVAGFLAPDALAERIGRRRRAAVVVELPDALDLVAVGISSGRSLRAVLGEVAASGPQPLASELAITLAEVDCGSTIVRALVTMRTRVPGAELGALVGAIERSRRHGSPLAEQLHTQASGLRLDARRRVGERAARAAPKIQLVIALVLVPSVLLTIVAALVAHSDVLFAGFR